MGSSLKGIKSIGKDGDTSEQVQTRYLRAAKTHLEGATNMDEVAKALWKAADETLHTREKGNNKRETHPEIKAILDERQMAIDRYDQQEIRRLTNRLKRKAEQIRAQRIIDSLEEEKWDPVELIMKGFTPDMSE